MSDELREAIARAIEPMGFHPSVSKDDPFAIMSRSKAMSSAQAALDAIRAAGWTLEPPPPPLPTEEELRAFRVGVGKAMDEVRRRYGKRLLEQNLGFGITPGMEAKINDWLNPETD